MSTSPSPEEQEERGSAGEDKAVAEEEGAGAAGEGMTPLDLFGSSGGAAGGGTYSPASSSSSSSPRTPGGRVIRSRSPSSAGSSPRFGAVCIEQSGWVVKQMRTTSLRQKRYVVVKDGELRYASSEDAEKKRTLLLKNFDVEVEEVVKLAGKTDPVVRLWNKSNKELHLTFHQSSDGPSAMEWVAALRSGGAGHFDESDYKFAVSDVLSHMHTRWLRRDTATIATLSIVLLVIVVCSMVLGGGTHRTAELRIAAVGADSPLCRVLSTGGDGPGPWIEARATLVPPANVQTWIGATVLSGPNSVPVWNATTVRKVEGGLKMTVADFVLDLDKATFDTKAAPLQFCLTTGAESIALEYRILELGWFGQYQLTVALTLLIVWYVALASDIVSRVTGTLLFSTISLFVLLMLGKLPSMKMVLGWMDESTQALVFGLMIMAHSLSSTGVFEWCAVQAISRANGSCWTLFSLFCGISAMLSALLDNVTIVLLLVPTAVMVCELVGAREAVVPFVLGLTVFANIGGSATLVGDPPNIIIGIELSDHVTFSDFFIYATPIVVIAALPAYGIMKLMFRDSIPTPKFAVDIEKLQSAHVVHHMPHLVECGIIFGLVLFMFLTHPLHHTNPAWVAVIGGVMMLLITNTHDVRQALERMEWDTLMFFAALFIFMEALKELQLITLLSDFEVAAALDDVENDDERTQLAIFGALWISALVSGITNNIPFTQSMVQVIRRLSAQPRFVNQIQPLIWSLSIGACFGGNISIVASGANVAAASSTTHYGYDLNFMSFMRVGLPITIATVTLANIYLLLVFHAGVPGPLVAVIVAAITGAIYTAVYAISHEEEKLDSSLTTAELTVVEGEAENIQNPMHDADA